MGLGCSPIRAEVASVNTVQLWMIELVSESRCETLNDMISKAQKREICLEHLRRRVLCWRLQTKSHRMVIRHCQGLVVLVIVID